MTDQEKKDLAQAYQLMLDTAAWKHFEKTILDSIKQRAVFDEDAMPITDLNPGFYGVCRGKRQAIDKIKKDIIYILEGAN